MEKIDLKLKSEHLYNTSTEESTFVEVPSMNFIMIDGEGNPHSSNGNYNAVDVLTEVSYILNLISRKNLQIDYPAMPVEILWWNETNPTVDSISDGDSLKWTAMIRQPDCITKDLFNKAVKQVEYKGYNGISDKIEYESFYEGLSVQIMDTGSYDTIFNSKSKINDFINNNSLIENGNYHEIFISGLRKFKLENIKSILRQPVKRQINS
jgi:hypothetical protein